MQSLLIDKKRTEKIKVDSGTREPTLDSEIARGVGLKLGNMHFVVAVDQVQEIASFDKLTPVPMTQPWLVGVTVVADEIYTVCDLELFFDQKSKPPTQAVNIHPTNIIVLQSADMRCALLDRHRLGFTEYKLVNTGAVAEDCMASVKPYVDAFVEVSGENWYRFDVAGLLSDPEFINAQSSEQYHTVPSG